MPQWIEQDVWYPNVHCGPSIVRSPEDAEQVAAAWVRRLGFGDAEATPQGNDFGIDVWSAGAVAQVKRWVPKRVGAPDVQQIAGAASLGQIPMIFSTSGYTAPALKWARQPEVTVAVFELREDGCVKALNTPAVRVLDRAPYRPHPDEPMGGKLSMLLRFGPFILTLYSLLVLPGLAMLGDIILNGPVNPEPGTRVGAAMYFAVLAVGVTLSLRFCPPVLWSRLRNSKRRLWLRMFDVYSTAPAPRFRDMSSPAFRFVGVPWFVTDLDDKFERRFHDWREKRSRRRTVRRARAHPHNCPFGISSSRHQKPGRSSCGCHDIVFGQIEDTMAMFADLKRELEAGSGNTNRQGR